MDLLGVYLLLALLWITGDVETASVLSAFGNSLHSIWFESGQG